MKKQKNKKQKIFISGYYGFGNMGDEGILASMITQIKNELPDSLIYVLTADRESLEHYKNSDVRPVPRANILAIFAALLSADLFISGGGSLLQDHTSKRSLFYYCLLLHLAKLCRCKTAILANGIGPLKSKSLCRLTLLCADRISFRDSVSYAAAKSLAEKHPDISLSADLAFSYPFHTVKRPFLSCLCALSGKPFFAVSLRKCDRGEKICEGEILKAIEHYKKRGYAPVFVPMQESFDLEICQRMAKASGGVVADVRSLGDMLFLLEKSSFAIGMRLHFLLTAAIAGVPFIPLSYDCKINNCTSGLTDATCLCAFSATAKEIIDATNKAISGFSKSEMHSECKRLSILAGEDIRDTLSLIKDTCAEKDKSAANKKFFADT